jgi:tRNA(Met) cytidine acetyltransferase
LYSADIMNSKITSLIDRVLREAKDCFHRRCIILSGGQAWCHGKLEEICTANSLANLLLITNTKTDVGNNKTIAPTEALQFLGHEFDHAVIDFHDGIDPNILGAISGTVCGGGLLILLMPPLPTLKDFADPEKQRMTIWPYEVKDVGQRFLQRLHKIITQSDNVTLLPENETLPEQPNIESKTNLAAYLEREACRTIDQQQAVEYILHMAHGHRYRPLVITANRGRGKSAALGIAAASLLQEGIERILVTGPRLNSTAMVFKHAQSLLPDARYSPGKLINNSGRLEYLAPDVLCRESPKCGLLLVDEAAAIPVPMLHHMLKNYARIVFATTTYGYEGTGRGFAIKFQDILSQETPGWQAQEMNIPIRWAPHDPVETFIFRCLCLDARVDTLESTINPRQVVFEKLDRDTLVDNTIDSEKLLSEIFGLLVLAHYQTQPRDLRYLLDAIGLDIYIARYNDIVIGTAVTEREGDIDPETARAVYRNERRVTGHLLPQTLESFVGIKNASAASYLRVVRIAVHPELRRQGIGQQLLQYIESDAKISGLDIIGSNFGASSDLLAFWYKAGYLPMHIGLKRNTSTGTHAITYLKPLTDCGKNICQQSNNKLAKQFSFQLAEAYQALDTEVVAEVYNALATSNILQLTSDEWEDISSFADSLRGYEINTMPIHKFIQYGFSNGLIHKTCSAGELQLLIKKVLQRQSWQDIVTSLHFEGKRQAVQALRIVISKLVNDTTISNNIEIEPGD